MIAPSRRPAAALRSRLGRLRLLGALVLAAAACREPTHRDDDPPASTERLLITRDSIVRLTVGGMRALSVHRIDAVTGDTLPLGGTPVWSVSDPEVALVEASGRLTGIGAGYSRVRVRVDTLIDSTWAAVPLGLPPTPYFTFENDSTISPFHREALQRAAERWGMILSALEEPAELVVTNPACRLPAPVSGTERGVRVIVDTARLDNMANLFVCGRRDAHRPTLVYLRVSTHPNFARYSAEYWARVMFHELGHALGLVGDPVRPPGALAGVHLAAGYRHDHGRDPVGVGFTGGWHWTGLGPEIMDAVTVAESFVVGRTTLGRLLDTGYQVRWHQSGPLDLGSR